MDKFDSEDRLGKFEIFQKDRKISFRDIECPVRCGDCCAGCEYLSLIGCKLERKERPLVCNSYLCGDGTVAYYKSK